MSELLGILKTAPETNVDDFRTDLINACMHYLEIISTLPCDLPGAPCNISLTKRAEWLDVNVLNPGERLLAAIDDSQRPMFSTWPYPLTAPKFRDQSVLVAELTAVLQETRHLRDWLRSQQRDDAGHSQELRMEIFASLVKILRKHFPQLKPNRGSYDTSHRRRIGTYVDAMRLMFAQITGAHENLDRLIKAEISAPTD